MSTSINAQVVTRERILLYDFSEGSGTVINDKSGVAPLINLTIPDPAKVEWINKGLRVKEATIVKSSGDTTKIRSNDLFSKGFTIEVLIKPLNNTQGGPARVVTFSKDSGARNFTLGQDGNYYQQRFRTSQTNLNGSDLAIVTPANSIANPPVLQHVVYTRSPSGTTTFYLDGVKVQEGEVPGDSSTWDMTYEFGLFNETNYPTETRTWLGDIYLVAIYSTVLTPEEVVQNYVASYNLGSVTLAWDANTEENIGGYIIYYGTTSRYDPAVAMTIPSTIKSKCNLPDTGDLTESKQKCKESWERYCTCIEWESGAPEYICKTPPDKPDPACDSDYFKYDTQVDVKNVVEYKIDGLTKGVKYYFAVTAYNTNYPEKDNESKFSVELEYTTASGISGILNFRKVPDSNETFNSKP
jgi:hypothetical protein